MSEQQVSRPNSPAVANPASPTSPNMSSPRPGATTIFVGEGIPRQALLVGTRSPLSDAFSNHESTSSPNAAILHTFSNLPSYATSPMDALTSLELRIRWLEALTSGAGVYDTRSTGSSSRNKKTSEEESRSAGLLRKAAEVQHQLDQVVSENDQLRRFMNTCECHALLLGTKFRFLIGSLMVFLLPLL